MRLNRVADAAGLFVFHMSGTLFKDFTGRAAPGRDARLRKEAAPQNERRQRQYGDTLTQTDSQRYGRDVARLP